MCRSAGKGPLSKRVMAREPLWSDCQRGISWCSTRLAPRCRAVPRISDSPPSLKCQTRGCTRSRSQQISSRSVVMPRTLTAKRQISDLSSPHCALSSKRPRGDTCSASACSKSHSQILTRSSKRCRPHAERLCPCHGGLTVTTIAKQNNVITLINVFTVAPENQQQLLDLLVHATREVMAKQPGFVSANFHKSMDGTRVVNYAQWASKEAFEAMMRNPEARP